MTTRTATVEQVAQVSYPPADHETVTQVITDLADAGERAFYLRMGEPVPEVGALVTYGDHHASWMVEGRTVTAAKRGYNFDPYGDLH